MAHMKSSEKTAYKLQNSERELIYKLRNARRQQKHSAEKPAGFGARISDAVVAMMGSWGFIIQSAFLILWMCLNVMAYVKWDPYPFILLNLMLSFQAAYAAPFIMMSQNRQAMRDRENAQHDYDVNIKAELEIELLHEKIDLLRENEVVELLKIIKSLEEKIAQLPIVKK
jgi:uncharacterized membrane protein